DITVIDGVKLGMTTDEFFSQLDSLKIKQQVFYTKVLFTDLNELSNDKIRSYITDLFNTSEYRSKSTEHYGLYYPTTMTGTKNIIGLNILLAHTDAATAISKNGFTNVTKETSIPGISQDLSYNQIDDVTYMLSTKYGKPTDTLRYD